MLSFDFTHQPTVWLNGDQLSHGRDYLLQTDDSLNGWLYLAVGLSAGDEVRVAAP